MYRSLAFSAFFVFATAMSLALASFSPEDESTGLERGDRVEFKGDRRPGILREPSEQPMNPGENGVYYELTGAASGDQR